MMREVLIHSVKASARWAADGSRRAYSHASSWLWGVLYGSEEHEALRDRIQGVALTVKARAGEEARDLVREQEVGVVGQGDGDRALHHPACKPVPAVGSVGDGGAAADRKRVDAGAK